MRFTKSVILLVWASVSLVWVLASSVGGVVTWGQSMQGIHAVYKQRENQCIARYSDPLAHERCLQIMDLERVQAQSISILNRFLLVACPPIVSFGLVFFLYRGPPTKTARHRRGMQR